MALCCKLLSLGLLAVSPFILSACAGWWAPAAPSPPAIISDDLEVDSLRAALRHSAAYLAKLPAERVVGEWPRRLTAREVKNSLSEFELLLNHWSCAECLTREIKKRFDLIPTSSDPRSSDLLFTGYYQPVIDGSLSPSDEYRYPLYSKPPDLISAERVVLTPKFSAEKVIGRVEGEQFMPYHSRADIDQRGALRGRGLEIVWVKDPVEVFFLHIQGSGIIRLPDGKQLSVGYAAQNGYPYRSIGRLLIDNGEIAQEEMSMQRLRQYLDDHPQERNAIFAYNQSYIFFRVTAEGPLGSLEVPVTPGRSVATDARLFPKGALALMQTEIPVIDEAGQLTGWRPVSRFVLNQDSGGAIRGAQRADYYFGTGDHAGDLAGYMNRAGKLFFVLLKQGDGKIPD